MPKLRPVFWPHRPCRVIFADPTELTPVGTTFTEAGANNGTIGNTNTINLAGDLFVSGAFTEGVHYTVTNVPAGLTLGVVGAGSLATVTLTGTAAVHTAAASVANMTLTFLEAAFSGGSASVLGNPIVYAVNFSDPASLVYSGSVFTESSGGVIDNRIPVTITLGGDIFAGQVGDEFVSKGWVTVTNLPASLTASITRDSDTQLSVRIGGVALSNAVSNSVSNVRFTFLNSAFANAAAVLVTGNPKSDLSVVFVDDNGFFNVMPYEEPFERYASGFFMAGTNGWSAAYADSGIVTNDPAMTALLPAYLRWHTGYPVSGTHTQLLFVQNAIGTEIHSEGSSMAYLDFMTIPIPMELDVDNDASRQYAFYVSTNQQLVVWHRNTTGGSPVNEWRTLSGAGTISTSQWVRFTVAQNYAARRFQIRVNEGLPVTDAVAWNDAGTGRSGSWFDMVQTNAYMTRFRMTGLGPAYVDDLTLKITPPAHSGGTIYTFR